MSPPCNHKAKTRLYLGVELHVAATRTAARCRREYTVVNEQVVQLSAQSKANFNKSCMNVSKALYRCQESLDETSVAPSTRSQQNQLSAAFVMNGQERMLTLMFCYSIKIGYMPSTSAMPNGCGVLE